MLRFWSLLLALAGSAAGAGVTAAEVARQVQEIGLDGNECYRVIDLNFSKEDLKVYLTSGYLIFAQPVNGIRTGAIFTAEVEGGDAELLLLPPIRSERMSLAAFTESPNLNEHFRSAVLLFTDQTGDELLSSLRTAGAKKVPEMGALLGEKLGPLLRNLASSFAVRLVEDTLSTPHGRGFFYMAVGGSKLGNFDVFHDPTGQESILVGQLNQRKGQNYFDVWTSFAGRARRNGEPVAGLAEMKLDNYRIDATVGPDLLLKATTRVTVTSPQALGRAIAFSISKQMRVSEAKVDGRPAEVFQRESLRSNLIRANGNEDFLVVAAEPLEAGKPHEFEFKHEGAVISTAGDQVYYVGSRGGWYPRRGLEFARYDLTFRYPKELGFVATGDVVEDRTEGAQRITRRTTTAPIRFAGFNLGNYKSVSVSHDPFKVEVFANRKLESWLQPKEPVLGPPTQILPHRRTIETAAPLPPPPPNPAARLEALAQNIAGALDFMSSQFGPPPIKTLTVAPIPGGFGQGFPGLLYLSTLAYLDPAQRPAAMRDRSQQTFFSEMLDAHEVAHQWWGNLVVAASYQDAWLMEALANYSALLFLEKRKGPHALETVLDDYKAHLLTKAANGHSLESSGPITWGYRLESSLAPDAWHYITYEKGAWVLHMLRKRLGDDRFAAMLRALCTRYRYQPVSTEQFRKLATEFIPPHAPDSDLNSFFENWVYGTGIPAVKLTYAVRGLKVAGTVTLSEVGEDFTARIPIEVQSGRQRIVQWVAASNEPVPFSIPVKAGPAKAGVDVHDALVTVKH